jgi:hypothetical protein
VPRHQRGAVPAAGLLAALLTGVLVTGAVDPLVRGGVAAAAAVTEALTDVESADPADGGMVQVARWTDVGWSLGWPGGETVHGQSISPRRPTGAQPPASPVPPDGTPLEPQRFPGWFAARPASMQAQLTPMESCPQQRGPGVTMPVRIDVLGSGRARVSWWSLGDPDTSSFRVRAVPVLTPTTDAAAAHTSTVSAPSDCRATTTTISGLASGVRYEFWLEAVTRSAVGGGAARAITRGRSGMQLVH